MLEPGGLHQQPVGLQLLQDGAVGVLHEQARPGGRLVHAALGIHQLEEGQVVLPTHPGVVLAESGGDVDDAGTVGHGDVIVGHHPPGALVHQVLLEVEQGLVGHAHQGAAGHFLQDIVQRLRAQHALQESLAHDDGAAFPGHPGVGVGGVHAQSHVAGQGPGGSGPGVQPGIALPLHLEAHEGAHFLHRLIALGYLVAGQGGTAPGAIGHHLVALVQQPLVRHPLQRPPHRFDILVGIGNIRIVHVGPEANPLGHPFPLALILPHRFLTFLNERLDAVSLDLLLAVQAQLLFHLQLHRQAVGIPPRLAQHLLALHGLVAGDQVLDGPGLDMADVGLSVGRGRAVVEGEGVPALALVDGLLKDVLPLPEGLHLLLPAGKVHVCRRFTNHVFLPSPKITPSPHGTKVFAVPPNLAQCARSSPPARHAL